MRAAATYYEERVPRLGDEFLTEVERVCSRLSEVSPWQRDSMRNIARLALRRFPFGLIYRLKSSKVVGQSTDLT